MKKNIRAIVAGATGYSGFELVRMLLRHPAIELVGAFASRTADSAPLASIHPQLTGRTSLDCHPYLEKTVEHLQPDLVFLATPNEFSNEVVPDLLKSGSTVVDISGAWRLKDPAAVSRFYGFETRDPGLLASAVYGLTEFAGEKLPGAKLIANPGCYPTTVQIPLLPLIQAGMIDLARTIICDSKSGVSGAGKSPNPGTHFVEVSESFKAYNVFRHRHGPEIAQGLGLPFSPDQIIFTPHLLPINRGILSTIYVRLQPGIGQNDVYRIWHEAFRDKQFIRIFEAGRLPEIKFAANTPYCDIGGIADGSQLIVVSAEDNLLKGAASQALQNANIALGLDEAAGIL